MSSEDFIFNAISADNISAFDLNVIASTLASTDALVRQNKQLQEENERLAQKMSSLRESALQIKNLYEAETAKTGRAEAQLASYVSQCQQLEQRCVAAENERVNTDLLLKERIAEYDRKLETHEAQYRGFISDVVRYYSSDQQGGGQSSDGGSVLKWNHLRTLAEKLELPDEVRTFFHQGASGQNRHRSRRKHGRAEMCDQECQTVVVEPKPAPRLRSSATNTDVPYPDEQREQHRDVAVPPVESKTFSDKGTMHSTMSTITRSTCTSAFIKRIDVGVNFPEVTHKSVDEILRECVQLPPLLLSPIKEILPVRSGQSVETQTDDICQPVEVTTAAVATTNKPQLVSCGTVTSLQNIRKRIDYRKAESAGGGAAAPSSSNRRHFINLVEQLEAKNIKLEEHNGGLEDTFGRMYPNFSTIWAMLGETVFSLVGSPGRRFDAQCYSMINEQLSTIRDMIEVNGRRESELMSAMFSNFRGTVEAAAGYGKEGRARDGVAFPMRPEEVSPSADHHTGDRCYRPMCAFVDRCHCRLSGDDCAEPRLNEKEHGSGVASAPYAPVPVDDVPFSKQQTKDICSGNDVVTTTVADLQAVGELVTDNASVPKETVTIDVAQSETMMEDGIEAIPQMRPLECTEFPEPPDSRPGDLAPEADEENDLIAQELRQIFEGVAKGPHKQRQAVKLSRVIVDRMQENTSTSPPEASAKADANGALSGFTSLSERPSTPPRAVVVGGPNSASTATFVSPIKVKETNELVKDQFKTPTQPPISKRKLRIRRSNESQGRPSYQQPKRPRLTGEAPTTITLPEGTGGDGGGGRLSPTTYFLLEDDWDAKFSSIKAEMCCAAIGGAAGGGEALRPLSPISDVEDVTEVVETERSLEPLVESSSELSMEETEGAAISSNEKEEPGCKTMPPVAIEPIVERIAADAGVNGGQSETERSIAGEEKMEVEAQLEEILPMKSPKIPEESPPQVSPGCSQTVPSDSEERKEQPVEAVASVVSVKNESSPKEEEVKQVETVPLDPGGVEDGEITDVPCREGAPEIVTELESPESPTWDSPMSPPAEEVGNNNSTNSSCEPPGAFCMDSPLSPPPISEEEMVALAKTTQPPRPIPLDHVTLRLQQHRATSAIHRAIECYKLERRFAVVNVHSGRHTEQEKGTMQQLVQVLQRYISQPSWTGALVEETITQMLTISRDARLIALTLLETVVCQEDIAVNVFCSPPAPPIPLTQQKLVLLVRHLAPRLCPEPFERVLMRELDRRVFQLKCDAQVSLSGLIALTFLYIGLEDSRPAIGAPWHRTYSARLYLFKCLYYFGYKCLPLVYYVLRAFPFALPKQSSPHYDNADAMVGTIRTILMNINHGEGGGVSGGAEAALYKKRELFSLLKYQYGYQPGSPSYEELVVNLVEKIRANRLRNVPYALVLVAKRKSYEWARTNIIQKRLYPLLNDYLKLLDLMGGGAGTELDERIVACIFTISSIMKTHPANEDVSGVMQIFTTIVQLARGHRTIQEEAIAGLVKLSRFGQADIFERLLHWKPTFPVSDRIKLMLATLLHRKDLRFWKQLMQNSIIDIDDRILKQCRNVVRPLLYDYVTPSEKPLTVEVWRGNVATPHECLRGTDAVIAIELIEHLHQPVLDKVPRNVFGFIKPKVALFSTPNAEYNVLFDGLLPNGFRHDDHKFEWTRAQFEEWASSICQRYPEYCVKYFGIGPAPAGSEGVGCVSQLALFVRRDFLSTLPKPPDTVAEPEPPATAGGQAGPSTHPKCWLDEETGEIVALAPPRPPQAAAAEAKGVDGDDESDENHEAYSVSGEFVVAGPSDAGWLSDVESNEGIDNGSDPEEEEDDFYFAMPDEQDRRAERVRNDSGNFEEDEEDHEANARQNNEEYWLIGREEYPVAPPDNRSAEERTRDEALYQLRRLRLLGDHFLNAEQDQYQIPVEAVWNCMGYGQPTIEKLRQLLTAEGYRINAHDAICLPVDVSSDEGRVDDFAEYDVDEADMADRRVEGEWEPNGANACPNAGAVEGLSLDDDREMWD